MNSPNTTFFVITLLITTATGFSQNTSLPYDSATAASFDFLNYEPFAKLQLEDTAGNLVSTASFLGKTIYVDFWFTTCAPCLKEIPFSASLQSFFAADTNIVFLSICIENVERKPAWKKMIQARQMVGVQLFYARNRPQKINLLRAYNITFPTYLLVNKELQITGYDAPRPSQQGWVHWAIAEGEKGKLLSASYKLASENAKEYLAFLNSHFLLQAKPGSGQ